MIDRRTFTRALAGSLLAAPFVSHAQKPAKIWRIGFLSGGPAQRMALRPPRYVRRLRSSATWTAKT